MSVAANIQEILSQIPNQVQLIAVSKTKPASLILEAYKAGQRSFGENKVQELTSKYEELPKDIQWHMIGHLQTNKVKYIAGFVSLIHGVDSLKLLDVINKEGQKNNRKIPCLLQIYIAKEDSKFGLDLNELEEIKVKANQGLFPFVSFRGLMGMASNSDDKVLIRNEFKFLKKVFDQNSSQFNNSQFDTLSMGMSSDYNIAIEEGTTMIRIGSALFGERNYNQS